MKRYKNTEMREKMEISVAELAKMEQGQYELVDIRSQKEFDYGCITGAQLSSIEDLLSAPPKEKNKKIIIYCSRGIISIDVADKLISMGYDAYSLKGGYYAWLTVNMQCNAYGESPEEAVLNLQETMNEMIDEMYMVEEFI